MRTYFRGFVRTTPVPLGQDAETHAGRLRIQVPLTAKVTEFRGSTADPVALADVTVRRAVDVYGPGDVTGLVARAIARTSPPDGAADVDGEFCPFVEFRSPDLPWRYSASPESVEGAAPWLALVAGREDTELGIDRDGTLWMRAALTRELDPQRAGAWAHTQGDAQQTRTARLVCPRTIPAGSHCLAVLVPLVRAGGGSWWTAGKPARGIPVLHRFRFTTNDTGTFESLVVELHPVPAPAGLGQVSVRVRLGDGQGAVDTTTTTYGALAPVAAPAHQPLPDPGIVDVVDERLEPQPSILPAPPDEPDGGAVAPAPVLGAARWSARFRHDATAPWVAEADTDPRHRAAAGLGARAGVAWQDRIMHAAAARLGQAQLAAALLRHLTGGVALARLTTRRNPTTPERLLAFYGPALGNVQVDQPATGETVDALTHLCPQTRALPPALLSAAATHLLRPTGPTAKAGTDPATVSDPGQVVAEALRCPPETQAPTTVYQPPDVVAVRTLASLWQIPEPAQDRQEGGCREPGATWLEEVVAGLDDAFRADGVPVSRVVTRISGLHERWDVPLEIRPDLDLPLWDWLRVHEPDWLLPRAGLIPQHGVVALRSDRPFIASLLLGASRQAVDELRWRGVPVSHGAMPMRTFWQHVESTANPAPMVDLVQPSSWPAVSLGGLPGPRGSAQDTVIALRSELVQRYPDTIVYLAPAVSVAGVEGRRPILDRPEHPSFAGRLEPDVWFFGFAVPPEQLDRYLVVLEEPDRGPRFYPPTRAQGAGYAVTPIEYTPDGQAEKGTELTDLVDGAQLAAATYARPIRAVLDTRALLTVPSEPFGSVPPPHLESS